MTSPTEAEVIEKATAGDTQAFRWLVEKHQQFAFSLAVRLVGNKTDAEDIVQEVFIRLWKNLSRYRKESKLTTWLYTIVTNCCFDFLKSPHRKRQQKTNSIEHHEYITYSKKSDEEIHRKEFTEIVLRMSKMLTPKQQIVFVLRDIEGLSVNEVSEILAMSPGNVKGNLYHARIKVSEMVKKYYSEAKIKMV